MGINFDVTSTLGFGVAISLVVYFGGQYLNRPDLVEAATPFVILFVGIWVIFIGFTILRNVASGI